MEWALLAATIGVILRIIERRLGVIAALITKLIGATWTLASYFVAPVMVSEDIGPLDALRRSARIFRETWGEELASQFSMGLIFILLGLVGFGLWSVLLVAGSAIVLYVATTFLFMYFISLAVANAAVQSIFTAALYQFATTKMIPPDFVPENFTTACGPKKKKLW